MEEMKEKSEVIDVENWTPMHAQGLVGTKYHDVTIVDGSIYLQELNKLNNDEDRNSHLSRLEKDSTILIKWGSSTLMNGKEEEVAVSSIRFVQPETAGKKRRRS